MNKPMPALMALTLAFTTAVSAYADSLSANAIRQSERLPAPTPERMTESMLEPTSELVSEPVSEPVPRQGKHSLVAQVQVQAQCHSQMVQALAVISQLTDLIDAGELAAVAMLAKQQAERKAKDPAVAVTTTLTAVLTATLTTIQPAQFTQASQSMQG